jgi:hypothetical protein
MKKRNLALLVLVSTMAGISQSKVTSAQQVKLYEILKLVHEDNHNPITFVVPITTTPAQLEQIVLQVREHVRAHQFPVLGMHIGDQRNHYDRSGMIAIYRSRKCIKEAYSDEPKPCGEYPNYDAYYQWGLGGIGLSTRERYECDAGGSRRHDGRVVDLFNESHKCQQLADSRGRVPRTD